MQPLHAARGRREPPSEGRDVCGEPYTSRRQVLESMNVDGANWRTVTSSESTATTGGYGLRHIGAEGKQPTLDPHLLRPHFRPPKCRWLSER
jgi:hypothetical protein